MSQTEWGKETESRIWNNMVETFENLDSRSFKKLKHKLIYKSPAGMKPITWRQVEEAREHELVNIIIRHYTIKHGPQMTVEILEEINERQASVELQAALMTSDNSIHGNNNKATQTEPADNSIHDKNDKATQTEPEIKHTLIEIMVSYRYSKFTLSNILDIGQENINEVAPQTVQDLPWALLRKLMALDRTARTIQLEKSKHSRADLEHAEEEKSNYMNPLDSLCVLLHCSDMFLQQNIFLKMSMCQFAVPLLLPDGDAPGCTFMLWAMRDITKRWRPHTMTESKGFIEKNFVKVKMPIISFARLGQSKLSKSKLLNQVLSSAQQYQDFFFHKDIECGNIKREISDGLVEISWFLPIGKETSYTFPEPVAITNLRGDIQSNWTQFSFLTQVSSAVFVFAESINERECELLAQCSKFNTEFYFIITPSDKGVSKETAVSLCQLVCALNLDKSNIKTIKPNNTELVANLQTTLKIFFKKCDKRVRLEDLANTATKLGIKVDENSQECQKAKECATDITKGIQDVVQYKEETMKLQGDLWKKVAQTEKKLSRMRHQGDKHTEEYQSQLIKQLQKLHKEQNQHTLPDTISKFISAITYLSQTEKLFFLKWMKLLLDSIARNNLSMLKDNCKDECNNKTNIQLGVEQLDNPLSESSLGVEHFLREMGQFYEAEYSIVNQGKMKLDQRKYSRLPILAADLLLDGFPLELIDGDASNIPLQWITDVVTELDNKTKWKCRLRVITVLGVQSTGKSTLLNTMFGLQFPVASGRCTRGAFMTLLRVKENLMKNLGCEFILVIDTGGLKAPEISTSDHYEYDNELVTLLVGLSDIIMINMAMENRREISDTLKIVAHAFLIIYEKGKKPNCLFVHQNMSDVSTNNNIRHIIKVLDQLDEITRVAASMQGKSKITHFSDIMDHDFQKDNWYIPALWYGVPPMASVNSGYSENVYELKKNVFQYLEKKASHQQPWKLLDFIKWIKSSWNSVNHENFIFSFRNSLVAEAYNQLATRYSQWEWDFRKQVHNWLISTENKIKNQSADELQPEISKAFKDDLISLIHKEEKNMFDLLKKYFESKNDVFLIEKYREEFNRGVKSLRGELENFITQKIRDTNWIQIRNCQIEDSFQEVMKKKEPNLLEHVGERESQLGDDEIKKEFENMWQSTIAEVQKNLLQKNNVSQEMLLDLQLDLSERRSSAIQKALNIKNLAQFGNGTFQLKDQHFNMKWYDLNSLKKTETILCVDVLIENCLNDATKMIYTGKYDCQMYCKELIRKINVSLIKKEFKNYDFTHDFDLDIKLYILGNAAQKFQMMHDHVLKTDIEPCMEKLKPYYLTVSIYKTQNRAKQFCELSLKPAIADHIYQHLGKDIVDDMLSNQISKELSSHTFFQLNILKKLLEKQEFSQYVTYINSYTMFVKQWLKQYVLNTCAKSLKKLQTNMLCEISKKIRAVLENSEDIPTVSEFLKRFCEMLKSELVISQIGLQLISFQNKADVRQFSKNIEIFLTETETQIRSEIESSSIESVLAKLTLKPEDVLFNRVFGCGKQCPFCKVPCEAGGTDHKEHFASVHRPQGLGTLSHECSSKLVIEKCSYSIINDSYFRNLDSEWKWYSHKDYHTIYRDWTIQPSMSSTASNYWNYIFAKYNKMFADQYDAEPADLPKEWHDISINEALESLEEIFKK